MRRFRMLARAVPAMASMFSLAAGSAPLPAPHAAVELCYPAAAVAAAPLAKVVALVDQTTVRGPAFGDMREALLARAREPGRFVVLAFSGLGRGEQPLRLLDAVRQPLPPAEWAQALPVKRHRALLSCLQRQGDQLTSALQEALERAGGHDEAEHAHSEIVHALHETIGQFARTEGPLLLLVHSDGLEHQAGPAGISFYRQRQPRVIDAEAELQRLAPEMRSLPVDATQARVLWWGLGVQAADAGGANYSAAALGSWTRFWGGLLTRWGVRSFTIAPTLLDPLAAASVQRTGREPDGRQP